MRAPAVREARGVDGIELTAGSGDATASSAAVRQNDLLAFAEAIPVIVWRADAAGLNDYLNAAWYAYTGLGLEQSRGTGWTVAIHADDQPHVQAAWVTAIGAGTPMEIEFRILGRDGAYRWFLVRGQPLPALDGGIAAWFGTCTDIDTQKRAAEALANAKDRAELLAEAETIFERSFATPSVIADLAALAIGSFATICFYDGVDDGGALTRLAAVHRDPGWQRRFDAARKDEWPWQFPQFPGDVLDQGVGRLIAPVEDAWIDGISTSPEQADAIRALAMNSAMSVPLIARGQRFGVLTFGRTGDMPAFTPDDLATAQELARRSAAMLENARIYALSRENESRAAAITDAVPQIFWTARADGAIDWFNRRWYEYSGHQPADSIGWGWESALHPREQGAVHAEWQRALVTSKPFETSYRLRGVDGVYRWFLTRVVPQTDAHGGVTRWYGATTNVDAERRATLQLAFFAELGQRLTSLPTLDATLEAVVESLVPNFADWAMVELRDDGDEHETTYVAAAEHAAPASRAALRDLIGKRGPRTTLSVATEAMRVGRPVIAYGNLPSPDGGAAAFASAVGVPLIVDAGVRGVLTLAMVEDTGAISDADLPFAQEIARRIAPALARAEIYERERRIAQTFQGAVLPRRLPEIAGLRFDALYEAGKAEALVGGDWFDAFRLTDGRIVITVGDVVGSGLAAATAMGEVRQSLRGAAAINPDPAILLDAADRILSDNLEDRFATAWVGIVDPIDFSVRYAAAGHPPPLVRDPDGSVRALDGEGLPLGLSATLAQRRTTFTTFIQPGSLLLLFTDGLIESERDALRDEALLAAALAATAAPSATARELRDAVLGDDAAHDDVAILLVEFIERLTECGEGVRAKRWTFDVTHASAASAARRALAAELRETGMGEDNVTTAELIAAELLGNVVRYASGRVHVILDCSADVPVLHIIDGGTGFEHNPRLPADAYSENGRGLFIVAELAREFTISRAPSGGSHARVVLETRGGPLIGSPAAAQLQRG
jgi:PAS domain S-box-containing protein